MSNAQQNQINMNQQDIEALIQRVATAAAREAVQQAFANLGLDISDPAQITAWHADRAWTRNAREGSSNIGKTIRTTIAGTLATAFVYGLWQILQIKFGAGH